ncbi:MAG: hypothetical protein JW927_12835 [Deltaproteobacteria bacterium]|nr:hypothetical protein [Deltaproteobacteria bacterium]
MPAFTLVLFVMLFLCCTPGNASKEHILFDFESDRELDEVNWQCHTLMSISDLHATHGKSSLKLEMYPSAYPGFSPFLSVNDWSKYKSLCFDVYNPDETEIRITVRIDDTKDNTEYKERYNQQFVLKKEMNHIRIDMESLVTSGTGRRMNSSTIDKFLIFSSSPVKKIVLYIDHIRLDTN